MFLMVYMDNLFVPTISCCRFIIIFFVSRGWLIFI